MSISTTYNEKILEKLLFEFFEDNQIPTADELLSAYKTYIAEHPDLTKPFILDGEYSVEEDEDSSASKYNTFLNQILEDLEVVYKEIWDRTGDSMDAFDRWRLEMEQIRRELIVEEQRIDGLLLVKNDTAGYFNFVEDNFVDFTKVDLTNTTAKVDITQHLVLLNEDLDAIEIQDLDTPEDRALQAKRATFILLNKDGVISTSNATGTNLISALSHKDNFWQYRVRSIYQNKQIDGEMKIQIGNNVASISRIDIELHASNTNSPTIITVLYSTDDHNWFNLPTERYVQSVDDRATFLFPKTRMKYVKFLMTKRGADDVDGDLFVYEFGLKSLRLLGTPGYDTETGNIFQSTALSAYDKDNTTIKFSKVALQACHETPDETQIKYFVKAYLSSSPSEITDWIAISPYNIENPVAPTLVDFALTVKSTQTALQLLPRSDSESIAFFRSYNETQNIDNFILIGNQAGSTVTYVEPSTVLLENLVFYRNVGDQGGTLSDHYVREAFRGWKYSDSTRTYMETVIIVNNQSGYTIDLKKTWALLNDVRIIGKYTIPAGTHRFKTLTANLGLITYPAGNDIATEDELKTALITGNIEVNHKVLIEGIKYDDDYPAVKEYLGVDLFCEAICRRVSIFNLLNNIPELQYNYFAVSEDTNNNYVFIVKFDPLNVDYHHERFRIDYVDDNGMYDTIILKANLISKSSAGDVTPILTAYRLKLGA